MKINKTEFEGLLVLEPDIYLDKRGIFMESYNYKRFVEFGIDVMFIQDNQSRSRKGVLRGLHFQNSPYAQTKLMRVLSGVILDIVVDLRKDQPTYKKFLTQELTSENNKQLFIPKGFAHGFLVLSESADVLYKTDQYYNPQSESGINFNDPSLGMNFLFEGRELIISDKDAKLPFIDELSFNF